MQRLRSSLACVLLLSGSLGAAEFPAQVDSAPCDKSPKIDGVIDADEWKTTKAIEFDMVFTSLNPPKTLARKCQFRVMNSGNGLYAALRVPDETRQQSLNPLEIDFAQLAFCRGKEVGVGDDRKVLAPGIYVDKHVSGPGTDADDARRDGRGAAVYKDGVYTFEWAVPLDSGDKQDLQVEPGDEFRFNLAYLDGFRPDLKGSWLGGLYGPQLDTAANWGTLRLSAKVLDDDGAAFRGPAWVADWLKSQPYPANRLRLIETDVAASRHGMFAKVTVEFDFADPLGKTQKARGRLYLPQSTQDSTVRFPLYFSAGYELDDLTALAHLERGAIVVSPCSLPVNPLVRTVSPDIALLHCVRSLRQVDDARVVIGGGSAGGYMALMLAAETFPLTGAAPDLPPFNFNYNAAVYLKQRRPILDPKPATRKVPALATILPIISQTAEVLGADTDGPQWTRHSPAAHVGTITCPVSVVWSTADVLVPIQQVGAKWVRPWNAEQFPEGLTFDPAALCGLQGQAQVIDILPERDYEIFEIALPAGVVKRSEPPKGAPVVIELPQSATKQWSISIVDEGAPEPNHDHLKYQWTWKRDAFFATAAKGQIAVGQLTQAKFNQLMARYAGREWVSAELKHLDDPGVERSDVLRGLRTYAKQSPAHGKRFAEMYGKLPKEQQLLPADEVAKLSEGP